MLSNCGAGEDSWQSHGWQDPTSQSYRKLTLNIHWRCWNWSSNTLGTWCEDSTLWKGPWCWEKLRAGGEGGNRGWDGWTASSTQWTWTSKLQEIMKDSEDCVLSHFNHVPLCGTLWTVACQAPLSVGFSRQEYWSGLPFPPPEDLPDWGIEP